jgi:hypothetical protein
MDGAGTTVEKLFVRRQAHLLHLSLAGATRIEQGTYLCCNFTQSGMKQQSV